MVMDKELKKVEVRLKLTEGNGLYSSESIDKAETAVRVMADAMAGLDREEVCVVNMDSKGHPINFNVVSIGSLNGSIIPMGNVFKTAILSNAASILLMHNHPSSDVSMSRQDENVTKQLMYAGQIMGIAVLDHIIVGGMTGECYSLRSHYPELFEPDYYGRKLQSVHDAGAACLENEVRENHLLYQTGQKAQYGIYQIAKGSPGDEYIFWGTDFVKKHGLDISGKDYNFIYSGTAEPGETLDSLYEKFNLYHPEDFTGHSLSVSDVIVWNDGKEPKAYYVDSYGFTELPDFVRQREQEISPDNLGEESTFLEIGNQREQGILSDNLGEENITAEIENQSTQEEKAENKTPANDPKSKKKTRAEAVREITEKLEHGLEELFDSDKFKEYLDTMSKFYHYSFNNSLLIAMQKPDATLVASYRSWQKNFNRNVNKGEKGIRILAPTPYKIKEEREVINPLSGLPMLDEKGDVQTEEVEVSLTGFKVAYVFDVSQTSEEPLPEIGAEELLQSVDDYQIFMEALWNVAPVLVEMQEVDGEAKGYFSPVKQKIVIQSRMSESQTVKTTVHEIAHSLLHDTDYARLEGVDVTEKKDRNTKEVEAEAVAYTVCQHFGIDTSDYSFGYVAGWSSGREMTELKKSMQTIQKTAAELIGKIEENIQKIRKKREVSPEMAQKTGERMREVLGTNETDRKQIENFKAETEKCFHKIDGMNASEVEQTAGEYIVQKIAEWGADAKLLGLAVIGSRCRGVERDSSDLDIVAEYQGDIREDDLFGILHEDGLQIGGIEVDINPIKEAKTGTLASYLTKAQEYMDRELAFSIADRYILIHETDGGYDYSILGEDYREIDGGVYDDSNVTIREVLQGIVEDLKQNPDTNGAKGRITEESELVPVNYGELKEKMEDAEHIETVNRIEPEVTFTVAECGEFPTLGNCYEGIKTADEAVEIWQRVQSKNLNTVPGLGIHVHIPGQEDYMDGQIDLVSGRTIDVSILEYTPSMRKEPHVMAKVAELIHRLPDYEIIGDIQPELFVWLDVPDGTVNVLDMKEYGYQWDRMLPMGKEKAMELYQKGLMVQKLYPNDTETYVQGVEDLQGHDGMFGVEKGDWEKWREGREISKQESTYRKKVR
ncbi:ImmA/IrrE family metallo-endopeptidase [bacterium 1xD8-6]|nr:ImmA/IrrE family metallo-endopeptidase [bacterium D16-36]RKI64740.1 ImmA/IrrE family metallo-endopeptidase [bacterium 1xD8-6]